MLELGSGSVMQSCRGYICYKLTVEMNFVCLAPERQRACYLDLSLAAHIGAMICFGKVPVK